MKQTWVLASYSISKIPQILKLSTVQDIKPAIHLEKDVSHYTIKTVTTKQELRDVLELRFNVFFREFSKPKIDPPFRALDIDSHDFLCDHLIIKDKKNNKVVACYRLLSSNNKPENKPFYSESEFIMNDFLNLSDIKLELGRACVHPEYRKGTVILLLWRGLIEYAQKSNTRYLFGCSSINRSQFANLPLILSEIEEQNAYIKEWHIGIQSAYRYDLEMLNSYLVKQPKPIHSLMGIYINAGAKVSQQMAYDREMNCLDLLTILDMNILPAVYKKNMNS